MKNPPVASVEHLILEGDQREIATQRASRNEPSPPTWVAPQRSAHDAARARDGKDVHRPRRSTRTSTGHLRCDSDQPRAETLNARVTSKLGARLDGPFDSGDGPGGWILLDEPELHLGDAVLVPDLAGWRRERMPHVPEDLVAFELAPDWVCEALSPKTSTLDRVRKMPVYASA